jgi:hypothetical protein
MAGKHTPAPWRVAEQEEFMDVDGIIVSSCNTHEIRPVGPQKLGEEMADLMLIASAPELLASLEHILGVAMADEPRDLPGIAKTAREAIAKAKGGAA